MLPNLSRNRKTTGLILAGVAAFAYYRYSKMSTEEKNDLINTITKVGKNLLGQFMGGGSKNEVANTSDSNNYPGAVM